MSRIEYVNVSGLRVDGRRPAETRRVRTQLGLFPRADGSALFEQGNTKVLAAVYGPREPARRGAAEADAAVLACEYSVAPYAASERRKRRGGDRRSAEVSAALRQVFSTVVETALYPRSEISIQVHVLQSDGGALAAAINAATLALIDAGVAMRDYVTACGVVHIARVSLLDPNFVESSSGAPEVTVAVLPRSGAVALCTTETGARLPLDMLEGVLELADAGCRQIFDIAQNAVKEHTSRRLLSRGTLTR